MSLANVLVLDMVSGFPSKECQTLKELLGNGESDWSRFDSEKESKETIAAILFTSGTTGFPKMAGLSHYALIASTISTLYDSRNRPYEVTFLYISPTETTANRTGY